MISPYKTEGDNVYFLFEVVLMYISDKNGSKTLKNTVSHRL